ncbi:LysM repeat protein [Ilumatobacter fluminis]|uniref:LysM repeat protein n=1 Tax=Ilumatobacter fluminis TaxID=467091 RepID=A0A4R7HW39_9ACTN|nr:LysM domain-containing protein [Ilumatobacter fluminis]TDT15115.1 LysM repeat protein [Ilumatobacter fluminis]
MRRLVIVPSLVVSAALVAASCGSEASSAIETLPPIRTTTSTSTTTTTIDPRGIIYIVQPGDNVNEIAKSYQVTAAMIIELNRLGADGEIQPGQELEIPNIRVDTTRPTLPPDSTDAP